MTLAAWKCTYFRNSSLTIASSLFCDQRLSRFPFSSLRLVNSIKFILYRPFTINILVTVTIVHIPQTKVQRNPNHSGDLSI